MIEVEVFGAPSHAGDDDESVGDPPEPGGPRTARLGLPAPSVDEVRGLCVLAAGSAGFREGHIAVEFVDAVRIAELNAEHRGERSPTDVLAFPMDGVQQRDRDGASGDCRGGARQQAAAGERELGDVVICPECTVDVRRAIIHGVLHLVGMDHETDGGEMLARERELLARTRT